MVLKMNSVQPQSSGQGSSVEPTGNADQTVHQGSTIDGNLRRLPKITERNQDAVNEDRTNDTSSSLPLDLDDSCLDIAELLEMILFEDDTEGGASTDISSDSSSDLFGIVDSLTLTDCKVLDLSLLEDEEDDSSEEDSDSLAVDESSATKKRVSPRGHRRSGVRRGFQEDTIFFVKTKTS
jgi:hypothetical protein